MSDPRAQRGPGIGRGEIRTISNNSLEGVAAAKTPGQPHELKSGNPPVLSGHFDTGQPFRASALAKKRVLCLPC